MQRSAKQSKPSKKPGKAPKASVRNQSKMVGNSVAAAYATPQKGFAPQVQQGSDSIRVRHREFITSVNGSVAFTVQNAIALNPGLNASFPWLSQVAQAWEEYSFNSLAFEFVTRTGSTTTGSVILAPEYDASESNPVSEQIACAYEGVCEDAAWKDMRCVLPPGRLNAADKFRFVRSGPLSANQDIKFYDAGIMFMCTTEETSANAVGKLWVDYDVTFRIPQLGAVGTPPLGGGVLGAGVFSAANPIGSTAAVTANSKGIAIDANSVLSIQATGDYVVEYAITGTVITASAFVEGAGITLLSANTTFNGAATLLTSYRTYRVTNVATATVDVSLTATTVTAAVISVGQAPNSSLA